MPDDRDILIAALEKASQAYRNKYPQRTIIGPDPDSSIMEQLTAAISATAAYQTVADHILYSGRSGPHLSAPWLAERLFGKGERWGGDTSSAVDWLLKVLNTREAPGSFKVAIWGLSIEDEVTLSDSWRLKPFASLPDTYMKGRILERAKDITSKAAWLSHTHFNVPQVALMRDVSRFPYISSDEAAYIQIGQFENEARDICTIVEAASVGHPLAAGCFFEYADQDLDIELWQNPIAWILPEIHPFVSASTKSNGRAIQDDLRRYYALPSEMRDNLLRSMSRFTLSQCRRQMVDRVLDLTLAFEIAVSGGGEMAPPSWKVSVRSTQLIGGPISERQNNRSKINELYKLRNRVTHGSKLKDGDAVKHWNLVSDCTELFRFLMQSFLILGRKPEWNELELEPRKTDHTPNGF
jgi:hypothetical protein